MPFKGPFQIKLFYDSKKKLSGIYANLLSAYDTAAGVNSIASDWKERNLSAVMKIRNANVDYWLEQWKYPEFNVALPACY